MTYRLLMTKKDPRRSDFVLVGGDADLDPALRPSTSTSHALTGTTTTASTSPHGRGAQGSAPVVYSSDTIHYARTRNGSRATTTVTRTGPMGDVLQVGVIDWPVHLHDRPQLVVGTRNVTMARSGIYTSPERFTAANGDLYEWQIRDSQPQLVRLRGSNSYVASFVQSESGYWFRRKHTASLFIPREGYEILDDIVVTFIYFECKWRDKEGIRSRTSISGPIV